MAPSIWLRCETKPLEHRSALTPTTAKTLLDAGFDVTIEKDAQRIFEDEEFEKVGCKMVPHSSWVDKAPLETPVIGLKELPEGDTSPLKHTHIMFAHCYKEQGGWKDVLGRFKAGNGLLYDLEFLQDEKGRRVAAFGYHAGFAGAAAGLLALDSQLKEEKSLAELKPYPNESHMVSHVQKAVQNAKKLLDRPVRALVIGALGRCGRGACDLLVAAGLNESDILRWDMDETAKGGPFQEILDVDVFVNCIYLTSKIPSFISPESIQAAGSSRKLSVVVDVSCDTTNPNNPLPIYSINTTFDNPTVDVKVPEGSKRLTVVSIDHLPTLLPREASEQFSKDLLPSLLQLLKKDEARVWKEAKKLFEEKVALL